MIDTNNLKITAEKYGIVIPEGMLKYYDFIAEQLVEKNKCYNLTAILEPNDIINKHFIDSLTIVPVISKINKLGSVIDVGTGAGFPGTIAALALKENQSTLLDSSEKKINYLIDLIAEIGEGYAHSPKVVCSRAEEAAKNENHREKYDFAVSRAVASLNTLTELCVPLIKVGGFFVAMKGKNAENEIAEAKNAMSELNVVIEDMEKIILPDESERNILIMRKIGATPDKYPRRSAAIKKKPL
ncbi:MAG: 16S rRNA (guanine(527)-N(7))-methyltransferase RsmG [Clostridia bacterium]|nr:16S rRNA (guanine(527)-N(7))-methyltransferase RsmG [Clostridia bacterium]